MKKLFLILLFIQSIAIAQTKPHYNSSNLNSVRDNYIRLENAKGINKAFSVHTDTLKSWVLKQFGASYLTISGAATTYLSQANAINNYVSKSLGNSTYLPIVNPNASGTLTSEGINTNYLSVLHANPLNSTYSIAKFGGSGNEIGTIKNGDYLNFSQINFLGIPRWELQNYIGGSLQNKLSFVGSYIGVGTSSPQATLDIDGGLKVAANFNLLGAVDGSLAINNDLQFLSGENSTGGKTMLRLQNAGVGNLDSYFEIYRDYYTSSQGWIPGGSVFTLKNDFLGLGGQSNPQATLDLGTSGTLRWGKFAGTNKFLRSTNDNGDAQWATIDKTTVGLSNIDNTSDVDKPISAATQTALSEKSGLSNNNNFIGSNLFLTPIFANSTSTSSFSSVTGAWSNTGNLGIFSLRYNTKVGANTLTWNPVRLDGNGWVGIGMDPTQAFEVLGAAKFNSAITATSIAASGAVSAVSYSSTTGANFATSSGNVGIGTINPLSALDVRNSNGNIRVGSELNYSSLEWSNSSGFSAINSTGTSNWPILFRQNGNERMRISPAGNLGVGTQNPLFKIDVGLSSDDGIRLNGNAGVNTYISYRESGVNEWTVGKRKTSGDFVFNNGGALAGIDFVTLKQNGNVGIGTTVPSEKFQVDVPNIANTKLLKFSTNNNANNYGDISVQSGELRYSSPFGIGIAPNNTVSAFFAANGNVGIGTVSASEKLHLVGSFLQTGLGFARFNASAFGFVPSLTGISIGYNLSGGVGESNFIWGTGGAAFPFRIQSYDGTNVVNRLAISVSGNVGIGITSPNAPLQFAQTLANRKIVLYEDFNNDFQFYGFGMNPSMTRYQVGNTNASHTFFAATGTNSNVQLFSIKGNGSISHQNLTTTQVNAITGMTAGDMVYNSTLNLFCFWNGSSWRKMDGSAM